MSSYSFLTPSRLLRGVRSERIPRNGTRARREIFFCQCVDTLLLPVDEPRWVIAQNGGSEACMPASVFGQKSSQEEEKPEFVVPAALASVSLEDSDDDDDNEEEESSSEEGKDGRDENQDQIDEQQTPSPLASSPRWVSPDKPPLRSVPVGRTVKFRCRAVGSPAPTLDWFKDGMDIRGENRLGGFKLGEGALTLRDAVPADSGNYSCVAFNVHGRIRRHFKLDIVERSSHRPILQAGLPANRSAVAGEDVRFSCHVDSDLTPFVEWIKVDEGGLPDGADGRPPGPVVKEAGANATKEELELLTLSNVSAADAGRYACVASNQNGASYHSAWLTVLEGPIPEPRLPPGYGQIFLYCLGFFVAATLTFGAVICKLCAASRKRKLTVHKLAKSVRLKRQVSLGSSWQRPSEKPPPCSGGGTAPVAAASPEYQLPHDPQWELPRGKLSLGKPLGEGCFGQVSSAQAAGLDRERPWRLTQVAVKMLKADAGPKDLADLVSEMEMMKRIGRHKNIINLIGACTLDGPLYVVVEYAARGNLRQHLRERRPDERQAGADLPELVSAAYQVGRGMAYLASKKCVHRDLAARNVLVTEELVMKIADFGLARDVRRADYYKKTTNGPLPVKWMAPEALFDRIYTHQSDVWSFGVLLWEIFTLGASPYPGVPVEDLFKLLKEGHRMDKPSACTQELYETMRECWHAIPSGRPTFPMLVRRLDGMLASLAKQDYLELDWNVAPRPSTE
ncbi:fibroblast growth factor receptor 1-A-like [Stigmatopora argus]